MNSKLTKTAGAAIAIFVLALAAYWYWSPLLVVKGMHTAAMNGDAKTFNENIDYPRLRESLKGQFSVMMAKKLAEQAKAGDPNAQLGAALGATFGMAMVNQIVDGLVQPEFVMNMMKGSKTTSVNQPPAQNQQKTEKNVEWKYERVNANKIIFFADDASHNKKNMPRIVFERSGFASWRLTDIILPAENS